MGVFFTPLLRNLVNRSVKVIESYLESQLLIFFFSSPFQAMLQELNFGAYLGLPAFLLPLNQEDNTNLARVLTNHIHTGHHSSMVWRKSLLFCCVLAWELGSVQDLLGSTQSVQGVFGKLQVTLLMPLPTHSFKMYKTHNSFLKLYS